MVTYPIFGQEVQVGLADYELPPLKVVEIILYGQTPSSPARGYCWQPRAKGRCGSVSWTGSRLRRTRVVRRLTPQPPWKVRSRPRSSSSADHGRVPGTWAASAACRSLMRATASGIHCLRGSYSSWETRPVGLDRATASDEIRSYADAVIGSRVAAPLVETQVQTRRCSLRRYAALSPCASAHRPTRKSRDRREPRVHAKAAVACSASIAVGNGSVHRQCIGLQ